MLREADRRIEANRRAAAAASAALDVPPTSNQPATLALLPLYSQCGSQSAPPFGGESLLHLLDESERRDKLARRTV